MSDSDTDNEEAPAASFLGVLSGALERPYLDDWAVSRAGGSPVWCGAVPPEADDPAGLKCARCGGALVMVAQVYAPFSKHRVLHIFGCNSRACSAQSGGWRQ